LASGQWNLDQDCHGIAVVASFRGKLAISSSNNVYAVCLT